MRRTGREKEQGTSVPVSISVHEFMYVTEGKREGAIEG